MMVCGVPNMQVTSSSFLLRIMGGIMFKYSRAMSMTTKYNSKKMALLIGVNYVKKKVVGLRPLPGCHNNVEMTKQYLIKYCGFLPENIIVLIDSENCDSHTEPTRYNILTQLSKLARSANSGDVLFVYFSGHGSRRPSQAEDHGTGFDEYICASDGKHITDDDLKRYVNKVKVGCRITIVADCCHSGGMIKAAKEQIGDSTKKDIGPRSSSPHDGVILLSACQSYEIAYHKVFTEAIATVIEQTGGEVTNYQLVMRAREILKTRSFEQNPGLYCSDLNAHAYYLH